MSRSFIKNRTLYPIAIIGVILAGITCRVLFFEVYIVPSVSMEKTIIPGDVILVSKLGYGARMPTSPFQIPWINVLYYMNKNTRMKADSVWWKYRRISGLRGYKHRDIVVFNLPDSTNRVMVKRSVALPGDTITVRSSSVFVNGKMQVFPHTLDDSVVDQNPYASDTICSVFPWNNRFKWSLTHFGPMVVPSRGLKITLNDSTVSLYLNAILHEEKKNVTHDEQGYYINGKISTDYVFEKDYFFVMGDNRSNSYDSRYWGFLCEDRVIGRAVTVIFSCYDKKCAWKRTALKLR